MHAADFAPVRPLRVRAADVALTDRRARDLTYAQAASGLARRPRPLR
jgi:hypothetical protein